MRIALGLIIIAVALIGRVDVARSDWAEAASELTCHEDENSFMVRFGRNVSGFIAEENFIQLTPALAADWFLPPRDVFECKLKNGKSISLESTVGQYFGYGRGGADPSGFFTLKVDGVPLYYRRRFYAGYGSEEFEVGAVIYRDGVLSQCGVTPPKDNEPYGTLSACSDVSPRLSGQALTDEEKDALARDQERKVLAANLSPECKAFREQPRLTAAPLTVTSGVGALSEYSTDIDNDGKPDRVIRIGGRAEDCASCGTHYFDGSILVAFPEKGGNADGFLNFLSTKDNNNLDLEALPELKALSDFGGYVLSDTVSGASIRYVYNVPFESGGKTYIYAFTANREQLPPATIVQVLPNHALKTICKFDTPDER